MEIRFSNPAPLEVSAEGIKIIQGPPGATPQIGANGNWWIGGEDTGTKAQGGGITEHNLLSGRDEADQHPITAIAGLTAALESTAQKMSPDIYDPTARRQDIFAYVDRLIKELGPPEIPPAVTMTAVMESGKISRTTGEAYKDRTGIRTADFIDVPSGCRLFFRASNKMNACFICYDKAKEYIAGWNQSYGYKWRDSGDSFKPPEGAAYIRFYCESTDLAATYTISLYALETVPEFVGAEAARVAGTVQAHRSANSFTFTCMSDMHYEAKDEETTFAILHTAQGLERLHNLLALDLAVFLGDYVSGDTDDTVEIIKDGLTFVRKTFLPALREIPALWCDGNHDKNYYSAIDMTPDEMYAHLGTNNKGAVTDYGNRQRNYGYRDFPEAKLRCIYLNTSDTSDMATADTSVYATAAQAGWLAHIALDLSGKPDAGDWGIVLFSHIPLSWNTSKLVYLVDVLDAYINGASGSVTAADGVKVEYDFSAAVRGEIICAFHGHTHNFAAETLGASAIRSVACPQICSGRYNQYAVDNSPFGEYDADGNPVYRYKTPGTAKDTSFLVVTIDRNAKRIYAAAFGEGIDREFSYALPLADVEEASVTQDVALTLGKGVSSSSGEVRDEAAMSATVDMIRVSYGAAVTITNTLSAKAKVVCYNAYGNHIKGWNGGYDYKWVSSGGSVTLPKTAAYIRFPIGVPDGTTEVGATVTSVKPQQA